MKNFVCGAMVLLWAAAACVQAQDVILSGAGATFPHPLYQEWFKKYKEERGVRIDYQAVGSGEGINRLLEQSVDFGGTDAFLSDKDLEKAGRPIVHIPTCIGAVVLSYNLPGQPGLRLTPGLIEAIFLGQAERWNDPRIQKVNPTLQLPDLPVRIIHRSDSSGTTFIFTDYLSKISRTWDKQVGRGKRVKWPAGMGVDGNPSVAQYIKKVPGSIGYLELTYATEHQLATALVCNRKGNFIRPTPQSVSLAAGVELPADTRLMITDTASPTGYPICAFTYIIVFREQAYRERSQTQAQALEDLLCWMLTEGQQSVSRLNYAPLPPQALPTIQKAVHSLTYEGKPLATGHKE